METESIDLWNFSLYVNIAKKKVHVYILIANKQAIYASQQPVCHYSYMQTRKILFHVPNEGASLSLGKVWSERKIHSKNISL